MCEEFMVRDLMSPLLSQSVESEERSSSAEREAEPREDAIRRIEAEPREAAICRIEAGPCEAASCRDKADQLESLRAWFLLEKRSFPWRVEDVSPYQVLVSEIMLQQTRAEVVVPYFLRWMDQFPDFDALAEASWEVVLKAWEGLGYYSRARRLHEMAKRVVSDHGGVLPSNPEALAALPGCGPYTVGAVRAFAFHQRAAAVDGNVLRVWSRLYAQDAPIDLPKTSTRIRQEVEEALPGSRPWEITEALIELGATICLPKAPRCAACPLKGLCKAHQDGKQHLLPLKRERKQPIILEQAALLAISPEGVLLVQGQPGEVFGEIWRLPTWEESSEGRHAMREWTREPVRRFLLHKPILHCYTHFRCYLWPYLCHMNMARPMERGVWVCWEKLPQITLASGHREILSRWQSAQSESNGFPLQLSL